jgi:hypothetical protein
MATPGKQQNIPVNTVYGTYGQPDGISGSAYNQWAQFGDMGGAPAWMQPGKKLTGWTRYTTPPAPSFGYNASNEDGLPQGANLTRPNTGWFDTSTYVPIWEQDSAPAQAQAPAAVQAAPAVTNQGQAAAEVAAQQAEINKNTQQSAENVRLSGLSAQAQSILDSLAGSMGGLTSKTGYGIDNARAQSQQASDILAQILGSGAVSQGLYDASGANLLKTRLGSYGSTLDTLTGQRQAELTALLSGAQGQMTTASGLNDWDEANLRKAISAITGAQDTLGTYQGGDVAGAADALRSIYGGVNTRLTNLGTKRGEIETGAQDIYKNLQAGTYRGLGELTPYEQQVEALKGNLDKWGASQATDEYQAILDMLGVNRTRLQGEADKIASQDAEAAKRYRQLQGDLSTGARAPLSPQAIGASTNIAGTNLQSLQNDKQDVSGYDTAALLRALGLA